MSMSVSDSTHDWDDDVRGKADIISFSKTIRRNNRMDETNPKPSPIQS